MTVPYEFSLMVAGLDEDKLDDIYEATDGAATVEIGHPSWNRVSFECEEGDLGDVILAAINNLEQVPGIQVMRVEPDELIWASEIAARTGRSRQSVDQLIKGQRGPGHFPAPAIGNARNPLWHWTEVHKWFARYEDASIDDTSGEVIGAINGALESRNHLRISGDSHLADRLGGMVAEQAGRR